MEFSDYERGVLGLPSKSGFETPMYKHGSRGRRDPLTGSIREEDFEQYYFSGGSVIDLDDEQVQKLLKGFVRGVAALAFAGAVGGAFFYGKKYFKYGSFEEPKYYVSADNVNVYSGPGFNYERLSDEPLRQGACLYHEKTEKNGWARVSFPNANRSIDYYVSRKGYEKISRSRIGRDGCNVMKIDFNDNVVSNSSDRRRNRRIDRDNRYVDVPKTMCVNARQGLHIRSEASISGESLGVLPLSSRVDFLSVSQANSDWFYIRSNIEGKAVAGYSYGRFISQCPK